eukprot:7136622-Karenia_brevis.AAC.1
MPHGPSCVFGDILQFTDDKMRKMVGLDGGRVQSNRKLRKHIPWMTINRKVWHVKVFNGVSWYAM